MILHRFENGDVLERFDNALVVRLSGRRNVLSSAAYNGGFRKDLKWVFNQDCNQDNKDIRNSGEPAGKDYGGLKAPTYAEHMSIIATELGIDPLYSCGLSTAANMDNVSIQILKYEDTTVTAVVTAGVEVNGGRVGDPAAWHETDGQFVYSPGTVNILLFIDADLSEGALTQAVITCTEAKAAVLQELLAPSCYSSGIATGSGTDGIIIVANTEVTTRLSSAGKHCKLGELIGRTVMAAVRDALFFQTGLCAARQFSLIQRIGRFGVTEKSLWAKIEDNGMSYTEFILRLNQIAREREMVVHTSFYVHLLDQMQWGLIDAADARNAANELLIQMGMDSNILPVNAESSKIQSIMINAYSNGIAGIIYKMQRNLSMN